METTYKVKVWSIETRKGKRKTTYRVRWVVAEKRCDDTFDTFPLANNFRSALLTAVSKGEAFDIETGWPLSMLRARRKMTFFECACAYVDMKWKDASPKYRSSLVESMVSATIPMLKGKYQGEEATLRKALKVAYNKNTREGEHLPEIQHALSFARKASRDVAELGKPEIFRGVLDAMDLKLDGGQAARNTVRIRRTALGELIEYARVELKAISANPMDGVKLKKQKFVLAEVDPKAVVNPIQGRMLIDAAPPRLKAFFGLMYYAALRPEEAANLGKSDLTIPESGWGDIHLQGARPEVNGVWTDSGEASEVGPLKHRPAGHGRSVPCVPALTELLHNHLNTFGTAPDGRLFRGERDGGRIGSTVYGRAWAACRKAVFTAEVQAGPLAKRPYDLRHAAVSTWLAAGIEPTRVAKWAGHSLAVLLRVYAKCIDGGEQAARDRMGDALGDS
ncbi:tyrosine recombinase XerC [Amycolatopsis sp. Poz14]|uniref:site-specific integrase n=1 Tax=Amycolatopsis sp. Poz14 TaxID=1447705 RepID=UPI001EE8AD11|nr:integrase [Amycolatopsis sp. Poz14]MCG3748881.1 integrase [Amycolatopsis sp. Poz14]